MKNIKNYEDFLNEEINWKKTLSTAALGVGLALSNPSFAGDNYTKDRTWSPGDTIKTTGLKEIEDLKNQAQVIVSPNPAKDWVKVGFITNEYTGKFLSISLFSINGDLIDKKEANIYDVNSYFDISGTASGIYLVVVEFEKGIVTKKFVKIAFD